MNPAHETLRALGRELKEIAELPVQEEKRRLWRRLNGLQDCRPLVCIDQLPWHELNHLPELTCRCEDPFLRRVEWALRAILYKWRHFPADMVVEGYIELPRAIQGMHFGSHVKENILRTSADSDVASHEYVDQINDYDDLEALSPDVITVDHEQENRSLELLSGIFAGILPVKLKGVTIPCSVWDRITRMRSANSIVYDCIDRPEFTIAVAQKFRDLTMDTVNQCEAQGLLDAEQTLIHCTGAFTNELPGSGYDPQHPKTSDCWSFAMAQIFSTVSPQMHEEFDIDVMRPLYERFGLLYYGCCEPLDRKFDMIRKIKNIRKVSCSPWADPNAFAERAGHAYVMSYKPNPALIAGPSFLEDEIRGQLAEALSACRKQGARCEFILKDVSTVGCRPERLDKWEKIAMEIAGG